MDYNMLDPNPSIPFEGSTTQYNPPYMMGDKPFECNVCFKRFSQKAHLTTHRRTHTGEKPYACHICNKRFAQSSHLNTHKRIHSGEKPFYCVVCQMGFVNKKRLELHLQEAHKMESNVVGGDHGEPMPEYSMPYTDYVQDNGPAMMMHGNGMPGMMDGTHGMELAGGTGHRRKPMVVNRFNNDDASGSMIMGLPTDIIEDSESMLSKIKDEPSCSTDESSISKLGNSSPKLDEVGGDVDKTVAAKSSEDCYNEEAASGGTEGNIDASGDEGEVASVTSESNLSGSEQSLSSAHKKSLMSQNMGQIRRQCRKRIRYTAVNNQKQGGMHQSPIGTNSRICLVNFTSDDLLTHMMSRDDVYKCDFCCIIFQDAAMYHLHRSMHDKMDIRCCNNCGKMANDRYDFIAHFLSEHK